MERYRGFSFRFGTASGDQSGRNFTRATMLARVGPRPLTTTNQDNDAGDADMIVTPSRLELVPDVELLVPDLEEQIAQIADHFWLRTEHLAEQNWRLNLLHQVQVQSQANSLMAVHANAEHKTSRLAEIQHENTTQLARVMDETRQFLQQQLQAVARQQVDSDQALHRTLEERIQRAFVEAATARELALQQAQEADRLESEMKQAMNCLHTKLTDRIDEIARPESKKEVDAFAARLEAKWMDLAAEMETKIEKFARDAVDQRAAQIKEKGPAYSRIKHIAEKSASEVEARMKLALQQHMDAIRKDSASRIDSERKLTRQQVADSTTASEERVEARMRNALSAARRQLEGQIQRQADAQTASEAKLSAQLQAISDRVEALEGARETATESHGADGGVSSQRDLAFAVREATRKVKAAVEMCKKSANTNAGRRRQERIQAGILQGMQRLEASTREQNCTRGKKIVRLVAQLQQDVQRRGESVARLYEVPRPGVEFEMCDDL